MSQVHKRLSDAQIAFVLEQYGRGVITRASAQEALGPDKMRLAAGAPGFARPIDHR